MRVQLLSDLHLETETYRPEPAPGAEVLVLAGDIDSTWAGLDGFAGWPVPVLLVAGNHEFDQREWHDAWPALRARCAPLGIRLLECESVVLRAADGRRVRFVGTTRWSDFDLWGADQRGKAMRAASYFVRVMRATRGGLPFDPEAVREEALACRAWLADALQRVPERDAQGEPAWHATVAITHFGPSVRSADPRYGRQPGTASFCNADDDLIPLADVWVHGHLHCRHDYRVPRSDGREPTRVLSNARGHGHKGEAQGHDGQLTFTV